MEYQAVFSVFRGGKINYVIEQILIQGQQLLVAATFPAAIIWSSLALMKSIGSSEAAVVFSIF